MSPDNRRRLRTPQGTESFFLEEAYRHRQLLRMTEDHFASWGYLPVLTPVFDYYETYRPLLNHAQVERSYRFPDRDGELLMLRSDITLFLAKQMGLTLAGAKLPRRVYYADSILRHQEEEDISSDEFFQSGAELIGLPGRDGDLEILMLLRDLMDAMKLPEWRMHIGSRAILDAVLDDSADTEAAGDLLEIRDIDELHRLIRESGLPGAEARTELLLFLGTPDEFADAVPGLLNNCGAQDPDSPIAKAVMDLSELSSVLSRTSSMDRVRIDLSEHGGQPYYTGFTVRAYVEGANSAVASGGRYDNLLSSFGPPTPAAGFSLMMRKIEPLSGFAADAAAGAPVVQADGDTFTERYWDASTRRRTGERVTITGAKDNNS